ncbi:Disease resistance family protein [Rhynchospora pubera]|uniref:Disease resistance family protein n=1 Tax=Rhynchospora pubera TaxID=906938 RepID=A0AAV8GLY1_9POAL|nr:Disease resistance family protein [Rhynchospora pubera]
MAEVIVHLALNKLAEAAVTQTLRLYGAGRQLDSLQHELRWIQAFLEDAGAKKNLDHRAKTWVSEVREVAYQIEDVIDTFMADVDDHKNRQGVINALKQVLRNPKKLPIVRKLTSEMDAIENKLQKITEFTERYGINRELKEDLSSSTVLPRRPIKGVMLPDIDDTDVVGLEIDKENIVKLLLEPSIPRRCVVSIVGQGGLGKTTLAKKAYNSDKVKREFEIRVWLSISQQFEFINVLAMMLEGIRSLNQDEKDLLIDPKSQSRAVQRFALELHRLLKEKRYLIIMDDVWTSDLWDQVKDVLPDTQNGSRVLLTTRIFEIATKADPTCDPYNMNYLSTDESQELLLKKAFPFQDPKAYLDGLSDLPEKFTKRCGNLPLALIVVGGRLSRELPTYNCWHKILQKLNWHDGDEKNCTDILVTSYEDTPTFLKPCFMYFALFPEDYKFEVKDLFRMWVAEGFIPEKNGTTMEETAENYLEELVQRSMIQVVERNLSGSIKHCRIHDLLRDLAIEKAKENNFLQIISNRGDTCSNSSPMVRRAALLCHREDIMPYTGPYLRSLVYFGDRDLPIIDRYRNLKILWAEDRRFGEERFARTDPKNLKKMIQLRYCGYFLSPRGSMAAKCWKSIGHMRNLQTLYIDDCEYCPEADCMWNIKTLRHVILPFQFLGPPPKVELPNLQTVKGVEVRESWLVEGWPKMPNIRELCLLEFPPKYKESFCNFLSEVPHLTSLSMQFFGAAQAQYERLDLSSFPCYNHMQTLEVYGKWNNYECFGGVNQYKALDICLFPIHLIELIISFCVFEEDPMPIIEKLKNLRLLNLSFNVNKKLCCSAGGFHRLEYLELNHLKSLEEWKVEKGGMPLLKEIFILNCYDLVTVPELQHMTKLNKFTLGNGNKSLVERLQGDESYKLKHIPSIDIN